MKTIKLFLCLLLFFISTAAFAVGSVKVTINPSSVVNANAKWEINTWHGWLGPYDSGETINGFSADTHEIRFTDVSGWNSPESFSFTLEDGQTASFTKSYTANTGSVKITISPQEAVAAGAQWEINTWLGWLGPYDSGKAITGFTDDNVGIRFTDINGWKTPSQQSLNIEKGSVVSATAAYTKIQDEDTELPTINISTPTNNSTYNTNDSTVYLAGTAADNKAVTEVTWKNYLTGENGTASFSGSSWSADIDLNVGENKIRIYAYDAANNDQYDTIYITRNVITQNNEPVLKTVKANPSSILENGNTTLSSTWQDPESNFVVDVYARYRKQGASQWTEILLDYIGGSSTLAFSKAVNITDGVGQYEFQVKASDVEAIGNSPLHTTVWQGNGSFTVTSTPPPPSEDKAAFISETIKDYTFIGSEQAFEKAWTLKNAGTDTWDSGYKLQYESGSLLGAPQFVAITGTVPPNATYTFKVPMIAPKAQASNVDYKGDWRLVDASGNTVKIHNTSNNNIFETIWVLIKVKGTQPTTTRSQAAINKNGHLSSPTNGSSTGNITTGDSGGITGDNSHCEGDPIDTATGAQVINYTLLNVQGVLPIEFNLHYNSLLLDEGIAGRGWGINGMSASLETQANGDIKVLWSKNQSNLFTKNTDGSFNPVEIFCRFDVLKKNTEGTYSLTRKDNTVYEFNIEGQLSRLRNQHNQAVEFLYDTQGRLTKITEPESGVFLSYAYNADNLLETVTDLLNRQVKLEYDIHKNLIIITDAAAQKTTHTYDDKGQLLTVQTQERLLFSNVYDSEGRVVSQDDGNPNNQPLNLVYEDTPEGLHITTVTSRSGETRRYVHDNEYRIIETSNELGQVTKTSYNSDGKVALISNAKGQTTQFDYNAQGKVTLLTDAGNNQTQLEYDQNGDLTKSTNALNQESVLSYDAQRNLISRTNAKQETTSYTYNAQGQILTVTSPKGAISKIEYLNGLPVKITDAANNIRQLEYDTVGRVVKIIAPANQVTLLTYDAVNNLTQACDGLNRCIKMAYNSEGQLISFTDAKNNASYREYDENSNLVKQINALNQVTQYQYDAEDRLIKIIDAKNHSSQLGYDKTGRLISITDALNNTSKLEYDEIGNLTKQINALGNPIAILSYDVLNNVTSSSNALGHISQFEYDALNNLDKVTDPLNRVTEFKQDDVNRLVETVDAIGGQSSQAFDADGQRTHLQDPNQHESQFTFDQAGRLIETTIATGDSVKYRYKAGNLLADITNARGQKRDFVYDSIGRLVGWTDVDGEVTITYDNNDNVLTITEGTQVISREYDALDRVIKFTDVFGNVLLYAYDEVGNLKTLTYPDGKQVQYDYDEADRLRKVTDWASNETSYDYDVNGRLSKMLFANGVVMTRSYNSAGQIIQQHTFSPSGDVITQYDYSYDKAGNIVEEKFQPVAEIFPFNPIEMTYGKANRLATYQQQVVSFDTDGNMLKGPLNGELVDFVYDSRNRLIQAKDTSYVYDMENHRVKVGDTQYMVNPLPALSQTLVRTKADGSQTFYVYGLGLISEQSGDVYQVYHYDLRGSTMAMTDIAGTVSLRLQYGAYGELISHHPVEVDTPFLYNGRDGVMTDDSALYYMRARFYNPEIRRFVNQDVLLGVVSDGASLNRYAYVTGEPISFADPFGLIKFSEKDFEQMYREYPTRDWKNSYDGFYAEGVGGKVADNMLRSSGDYNNGCSIRLSSVLNSYIVNSGFHVSNSASRNNFLNGNIGTGFQGTSVYAYRARWLANTHITNTLGNPKIYNNIEDLYGKKGLIFFDMPGSYDHIDLWNKTNCPTGCSYSGNINFWEVTDYNLSINYIERCGYLLPYPDHWCYLNRGIITGGEK